MDIGTAKPTAEQRAATPHHLIDIVEPDRQFSLAEYLAAAEACVAEIRRRGKEVLFVGGTPLYLKGLLRGTFKGPAADPLLRRSLEQEERARPGTLHRRLAEVDPAAAERLHSNDLRRLVRALEVFLKTGVPISKWQRQFDRGLPAERCRVFLLDWPRAVLYRRVNRRVEAMFQQGLVDEVRSLLARERPLGRTASQAVGYREVIEHLEGRRGLDETIALVKQHTRQLAKRQGTWFRSLRGMPARADRRADRCPPRGGCDLCRGSRELDRSQRRRSSTIGGLLCPIARPGADRRGRSAPKSY